MREVHHFIGGKAVTGTSGRFGDIYNPNTGEIQGRVALATAAELGAADAPVFNHASTHGLNAIITRALPKIGFLTTAGHRDILDIGRTWRPVAALTDPSWRRSFGDAARPLVQRSSPATARSRLVLPQPDGPISTPMSPAPSPRLTASTAARAPPLRL